MVGKAHAIRISRDATFNSAEPVGVVGIVEATAVMADPIRAEFLGKRDLASSCRLFCRDATGAVCGVFDGGIEFRIAILSLLSQGENFA